MVDKYEDPFVKISAMIGGDEYLKVARSLLKLKMQQTKKLLLRQVLELTWLEECCMICLEKV